MVRTSGLRQSTRFRLRENHFNLGYSSLNANRELPPATETAEERLGALLGVSCDL